MFSEEEIITWIRKKIPTLYEYIGVLSGWTTYFDPEYVREKGDTFLSPYEICILAAYNVNDELMKIKDLLPEFVETIQNDSELLEEYNIKDPLKFVEKFLDSTSKYHETTEASEYYMTNFSKKIKAINIKDVNSYSKLNQFIFFLINSYNLHLQILNGDEVENQPPPILMLESMEVELIGHVHLYLGYWRCSRDRKKPKISNGDINKAKRKEKVKITKGIMKKEGKGIEFLRERKTKEFRDFARKVEGELDCSRATVIHVFDDILREDEKEKAPTFFNIEDFLKSRRH